MTWRSRRVTDLLSLGQLMDPNKPWRILVFGATGAIGATICENARGRGWSVVGVARRRADDGRPELLSYDPFDGGALVEHLPDRQRFDAVVWAQGANHSDSVYDFEQDSHMALYRANCVYVLETMRQLLDADLLRAGGARLCVISSIWQERARQIKLSYTMTKAAVGGLVRSAAIDLAVDGHLINGVLPGALDTPMTYANLASAQLKAIEGATPFNKLSSVNTVADLVNFLCSFENSSISGQSIAVDLGFSNVRLL